MGTWGAGLYSGDFALDLRSTIAALSRLPFDGERIRDLALAMESEVANDTTNSDHTTFWLVLADQFQKKGIRCADVTQRATALIDSGANAAMLKELGMPVAGLRKRAANLSKLRERLESPSAPRRRTTLKKPDRMIMTLGEVLLYPTSGGDPINPYFRSGREGWFGRSQDAWGAMLVVDAGLAFGYVAWYTVVVTKYEFDEKPDMDALMKASWVYGGSGTCSATHFKRMELALVGRVTVHREQLESKFKKLQPALQAAVLDIDIANRMDVISKNPHNPLIQRQMERTTAFELREFASLQS